jgi:hypothetical protein
MSFTTGKQVVQVSWSLERHQRRCYFISKSRMCGISSQAPDGHSCKFTASGSLTILDSGCGVSADYLVVGGGAAGGNGSTRRWRWSWWL